MQYPRVVIVVFLCVSVGLGCATGEAQREAQAVAAPQASTQQAAPQPRRQADVPFVPTPDEVVETMLKVANVTKQDVLYDLGSGDGRIVITAAKTYGTRGVGIDINPELVERARDNARQAGVSDLVRFVEQDLFTADISEATVVTLYLLPAVNLKLRPKLLAELKPGTRVVSHSFDMGDWKPQKTVEVNGRTVHFWVIPDNRTGHTAN